MFDDNYSINGTANVVISFDVQKLFGADGGTSIDPATQNETHTMNDPQLASIIADNYANAFSVTFPQ
jgi:ABC-type Zn uptake system ZnuABC Zn-binding protein ZnuA